MDGTVVGSGFVLQVVVDALAHRVLEEVLPLDLGVHDHGGDDDDGEDGSVQQVGGRWCGRRGRRWAGHGGHVGVDLDVMRFVRFQDIELLHAVIVTFRYHGEGEPSCELSPY